MGKRALHSSEMPHLPYLLWGCNILYSVQILTKGNQAWYFMCRVKPLGGGILKIKGLGQGDSRV
jgi:hypothetical protein